MYILVMELDGSVLIIGVHTRPAVFSAKSAGFEVYSVDYFGSMDTKSVADVSRSIVNQKPYCSLGRLSEDFSSEKLLELSEGLDTDYVLPTSTVDLKKGNIVGNSPDVMARLKDKEYQLKMVKKLGFRVPVSEVVCSREEAVEVADNLGYPVVLKPVRGAGGRGVFLVKSALDIPEITSPVLVQEYIRGKRLSVSTLSSSDDSRMLSTSVQILGSSLLNQRDFVYCGNIVPYLNFDSEILCEIERLAVEVSQSFGVVGWNGLDIAVSDEPVFLELNPRFQGTFGCVEKAYGVNLVDAHILACEGEIIDIPYPKNYSVRMTLFAKERSIVTQNLMGVSFDVPCQYAVVEGGEPITTVLESSTHKNNAIMDAVGKIKTLKHYSVAQYSN